MEAYVTLEEAASLEHRDYEAMKKCIQRNSEKYKVSFQKPENGGKDRVLIAVSSLSKPARNAWKEREKLRLLAEAKSDPETEKPARHPRGRAVVCRD